MERQLIKYGYKDIDSKYRGFNSLPKKKIRPARKIPSLWIGTRTEPSEYLFEILGQNFSIPIALEMIKDDIRLSKDLVLLESDWDNEGALPIDQNIYLTSIKFLIQYSTYIYKNKGIIIASPEINPCKDGTIDLSWRTKKARLLINFKFFGDKIMAFFYGDLYQNINPIKGIIPTDKVSDFFAIWMTNLVEIVPGQ